jgi:hypothetical protein
MKRLRKLSALITISVLLKVCALLTLLGLALMVWSMLEPTPLPVILAMSVGQVFGSLAFALFGGVVLVDQLRKQRAKGAAGAAAASAAVDSFTGTTGRIAALSPPDATTAGTVAAVPADGNPVAHAADASPAAATSAREAPP